MWDSLRYFDYTAPYTFSIDRGAGDDSNGVGGAEADQSSSKKQQAGGFSHGIGAIAGFATGIGLVCGVLFTPAAPVALAAVGLTEAMPFVLCLTAFGLAVLTGNVWNILEGAINWLHARVCSENALSYCTTGAKVGMLVGSAGIIAGSIYPPIAIACLAAVGCAATPVTLGVAAGVALISTMLAGCGLGAAWGYFFSESNISAKDAAVPDTPKSAELSRS